MQITKLLFVSALAIGALMAQNVANIMVNPEFTAFDNNGIVVPGAKLCTYSAGTTTPLATYTDSTGGTPNTNPVIMDASGRARVYGTGNYKFQLLQPGSTSDCTTGATIWTVDSYFVVNQSPSFATVTGTTFTSIASGATPAFNQNTGTFSITGAGDATFATVKASTTFNSLATGVTSAFQVQSGAFDVFGNGNFQGQQSALNQMRLTGYPGVPPANGCTACDAPGAGYGLIYYDTGSGALRYNLNNAGWNSFPTVPGSNTQVVYNNAGVLGASATFTFSASTLTLGGGAATGVIAPLFNSSNTGTNNAFQTGTGTFYVKGNGNLGAQVITIGQPTGAIVTGTPANSDTAGIITLGGGGTFTQNWPSGHTYTTNPTCVANDFTAVAATSVGASTTALVFNGTAGHQLQYICIGGLY